MCVGAAESEGAYGRSARHTRRYRPVCILRVDVKGAVFKIDVRVCFLEMKRRHQLLVPKAEQRLDQGRYAGRRQGMPDIGLNRTHRTISSFVRVTTECIGQRLYFDGIAQFGAGTVCLHVPDGFRMDVKSIVDIAFQGRLGRCAGGGDAVGSAVLVDFTPLDDPVDMIPVSSGLGQGLEQYDPDGFSGYESVGPVIKGFTLPIHSRHTETIGENMKLPGGHHLSAAGQSQVTGSGSDAFAGQVDGHQR